MSDYCLITDATTELNQEQVEKYNIRVIPMKVVLGGTEYTMYPDNHELSMKEFYERLTAGEETSTTQVTPAVFTEYFESVLKEGKDLIYYGLSSGLSGTYNSSCIAAEELSEKYPQRRIVCINSICASVGEGFMLMRAAQKKLSGADFDEVVRYIEENQANVCHWFMVENLEQLKKGGRISAVSAALGTALHICPILSTDREGALRVAAKVRGQKKAIAYLIERLKEDGIDIHEQSVMIGHANCPETAEKVKQILLDEDLVKDVGICEIGPVIGSHVGSGMCAILFEGENYKDLV